MTVVSQPSPLSAAQQHAQSQASAGDLAGARLTLEGALDAGRVNLGEDDPAVLAVAHQLATVLQRSDDFPAARRVLEEAFAAGQWRLGDADPLMLAISFDLGIVAEELGNRHEARRAFGRVTTHGPQVLGNEHWAVTQARAYLGEDPPTVRMTLDRPSTEPQRQTPPRPAPHLTPAPLPTPEPPQTPAPVQMPEPLQTPAPPPQPAPYPQPAPQPAPHPQPVAMPRPPPGPVPPLPPPGPAPVQRFGPDTQHRYPDTSSNVRHEPPWDERHARQQGAGVAVGDGRSAYRRSRGPVVFAAIAACLAAVIAVVALVVVLAGREPQGRDGDDSTTLGGNPPSDVRLRDLGSTVEVSWRDPTDGTVLFVVMAAHTDQQLTAMGRIGPGVTQYKLEGLNARLNYCFAVVAVYSGEKMATSPQTCTSRSTSTSTPAPTAAD